MSECKKTDYQDERSSWLRALRAASVVFLFLITFAQAAGAQRDPQKRASLPIPSRSQFAIDDFDGDNRPDLASVEAGQPDGCDTRYQIRFQLATGPLQTIALTAPVGGLQVRSRDVNGDSYPDVVVTTFWTNQPVAVLLNDGLGNFSQAEPSLFPGAFISSELSVTCGSHTINEAAALFERYFPGQCQERTSMSPLPSIVELFVAENLHFLPSSCGDFFFGRAPPSAGPRN